MSTAFQFNAFQADAFQIEGGVASGEITGSLDYTNRNDVFAGSAELGGEDLTAAKYGARKKKPNPNVRFKPTREPVVAKAEPKPQRKPSPLLLGLVAGLVPPEPAAVPQIAPIVPPIAEIVPPPPSFAAAEPEVVAPLPAPPSVEQLAETMAAMQAQLQALQAELAALRTARQPEPVAETARDPLHEALHAILPGLGDPVDLGDDEPDDGEAGLGLAAGMRPPPIVPPAPVPKMTDEEKRRENERRAHLLAKAML